MQEISTKDLSQEDLDYYNNIDITNNRDIFKTNYEDEKKGHFAIEGCEQ